MTCALSRAIRGSLVLGLALSIPAFSKCPISDGATLVVRATVGDLRFENTGKDTAEVQIENNLVQVQETCGKDVVEFRSNGPTEVRGTVAWRIIAPRTVNLYLVTQAGNIVVGDVDGNVILRTAGGSVTAGQIKGKAAIITQGGFIRSGNIGGNAEFRSQGGTLEVGD